jgi:hypothetical protein
MRLSTAASFFDKTVCADAFAPATTFLGQLDVFDDSKRDGATVLRRVLSTDPSIALPARRVLLIDGVYWIVGQNQDDHFNGAAIRRKYVIQRADGSVQIQTVAEAIAGAGGTATYGAKLWVKDLKEIEVSSKLTAYFNIYLPAPEAPTAGQIITLAGVLYMVRGVFKSAAGFLAAEVSELEAGAVAAATYSSAGAYDPSSDSYTPVDTPVTVLNMRWQDDYTYTGEASPKYAEGDRKAYVRTSEIAAAKAGDRVTIGGVVWTVLSVETEGACWGLHLRRAGT